MAWWRCAVPTVSGMTIDQAVAGLGGAGSIITEFLARLGVGELVLIEDDTVDNTNLPRLLGATPTTSAG